MKRSASLCLSLVLIAPSAVALDVITGSYKEFSGPDDLLLDPASNIIAVNTYGSEASLDVNGVTFLSAGLQPGSGVVTSGPVTVSTSATHVIDGWGTAPAYTGDDQTSADNLALIMHDIRWSLNPSNLTVDIAGLDGGTTYDVQMLFSENGSAADRHWDIGVDGALVVDDWISIGEGGTSSNTHGYVYSGEFDPGADGTLNIVMGVQPLPADPNNTPATGLDNNPILQAVIVHRVQGPAPPTEILLDNNEFPPTAPVGSVIGTLSSIDPNLLDTHTYALVSGDGDTDNGSFQIDGAELQTNADFSGSPAGTTFSIRVQSTDNGGLAFAQSLQVIAGLDADSDLLPDSWEMTFRPALADLNGLKSGPGPGADSGDFDDDGSGDLDEYQNGTDPTDEDSDDDGSTDGEEVTNMTDPLDPDSDSDGLTDGEENTLMTDPNLADTDGDTIIDGIEITNGTDPTLADTDNDGADDNIDFAPTDPDRFSATGVIVGEVIEFKGPDDLGLDPATSVIAANLGGDLDLDVNGVTFLADVAGGGTVSNGDVTLTTTATNQIANWATPAHGGNQTPAFTGDPTSAGNLAAVMTSIRWTPAPEPVAVEIAGLTPGALYEIQLLTNEGNDRNRQWDIAVEDALVVDNYTSEGLEGFQSWAPDNSFAYVGEFEGPGDGILNVLMQQDIPDGIPPRGTDNNPILQGVVVCLAVPANPFVITGLEQDPQSGLWTVTWNSSPGRRYALDYSPDLQQSPWEEIDDSITAEGESTSFEDFNVRPPGKGFYRVRLP